MKKWSHYNTEGSGRLPLNWMEPHGVSSGRVTHLLMRGKRTIQTVPCRHERKLLAHSGAGLACITGALWAKRGERGILHEAQRKQARNECGARVEGRRKRKLYVSHPLVSRFAQNAAFALLANKKRLLCWPVPGRLHKIKKEYKTATTRDDRVRLRGEVWTSVNCL